MSLASRLSWATPPRWATAAVFCGLIYAACGQGWLWLVYKQDGILAGRDVGTHTLPAQWLVLGTWLVGVLVVALGRSRASAAQAAFAAGLGLLIGVTLHLLLRTVAWSDLSGGCWVHRSPYVGEFSDQVCYDIVPNAGQDPVRFVWSFLTPVVTWGAAFAFLLASAVGGIRRLLSGRALTSAPNDR